MTDARIVSWLGLTIEIQRCLPYTGCGINWLSGMPDCARNEALIINSIGVR